MVPAAADAGGRDGAAITASSGAATLVIIGTILAFMAWFMPGMLQTATIVVIGGITELGQFTTDGRTGRNIAPTATVVLAAAMVAPFAFGFGSLCVAIAVSALLVLILTARRPTPAAALL